MIHILFVPGMFGSTLEYVLATYSNEINSAKDGRIADDGSMHAHTKENHWTNLKQIVDAYSTGNVSRISTPIYPFENMNLMDIVGVLEEYFQDQDSKILIYATDIDSAEINLLFQYHKIVVGKKYSLGLDVFFNKVDGYQQWNPAYTKWQDMQTWELREWLSIFYPAWIQEWIDSEHQVSGDFLKISNKQLLDNTVDTVSKIFDFCNLTPTQDLNTFLETWRSAQQYVLDEYSLILKIVDATINNQTLTWAPLNLAAEAIVQQRLRSQGYEIRCNGLNAFPTDSETLYNLLEKV